MYKNINSCLEPVIDFCTLDIFLSYIHCANIQDSLKRVKYQITHPHSKINNVN